MFVRAAPHRQTKMPETPTSPNNRKHTVAATPKSPDPRRKCLVCAKYPKKKGSGAWVRCPCYTPEPRPQQAKVVSPRPEPASAPPVKRNAMALARQNAMARAKPIKVDEGVWFAFTLTPYFP